MRLQCPILIISNLTWTSYFQLFVIWDTSGFILADDFVRRLLVAIRDIRIWLRPLQTHRTDLNVTGTMAQYDKNMRRPIDISYESQTSAI